MGIYDSGLSGGYGFSDLLFQQQMAKIRSSAERSLVEKEMEEKKEEILLLIESNL